MPYSCIQPPVGFETTTSWSEDGSSYHSAIQILRYSKYGNNMYGKLVSLLQEPTGV